MKGCMSVPTLSFLCMNGQFTLCWDMGLEVNRSGQFSAHKEDQHSFEQFFKGNS